MTELLPRYLRKYGNWVRAHGKDTTIKQSSVGSTVKTNVYRLTDLHLVIGGKALVLPHADVLAASEAYDWRPFYGIIGQDVLQSVPEIVFNFKDMVLRFP